jgi:hypothetical protein
VVQATSALGDRQETVSRVDVTANATATTSHALPARRTVLAVVRPDAILAFASVIAYTPREHGSPPDTWEELARDLRTATQFTSARFAIDPQEPAAKVARLAVDRYTYVCPLQGLVHLSPGPVVTLFHAPGVGTGRDPPTCRLYFAEQQPRLVLSN